ncbi:MAG: hypothetical protein WCJ77_01800 [Opitutae bacterium]|jgi:hypothetical protein
MRYSYQILDTGKNFSLWAMIKRFFDSEGYVQTPEEPSRFWVRYRRFFILVFALIAGWILAESILAWNFFDG